MIDFLKNLTKSREEKQAEQLHAYIDGELTKHDKTAFENQLKSDSALQEEVEQLQSYKQQLRNLPQYRVPRNFTLDPALYGAPKKEPWLQFYPAVRAATVLTAFFLILTIGLDLFTVGDVGNAPPQTASSVMTETDDGQIAMQEASPADAMDAEVAEDPMMDDFDIAEESMDEESMMEESEMAEEMVAEESMEVQGMAEEDEASDTVMVEPPANDDNAVSNDEEFSSMMVEPTPTTEATLTFSSPRLMDEEAIPNERFLPTNTMTITLNSDDTYDIASSEEILEETLPIQHATPSESGFSSLRWTQIILALLLVLFLIMQGVLKRRIQ